MKFFPNEEDRLKKKQARANKELIEACQKCDLRGISRPDRIAELVAKGADVNAKKGSGEPVFVLAAAAGFTDALKQLVELKADTSAYIIWRAFIMASVYNHPETAAYLAELDLPVKGADSNNDTFLHLAAQRGWLPVVRKLIEKGADPHARNRQGKTPEDVARDNGHTGVTLFLQKLTAPEPVVITTGWQLTEDPTKAEVALVTEKKSLGYCVTEIFNFNARQYTQITRNLATNVESQTTRFFDEFTDTQVLEQAHQQLLLRGGKGADFVARKFILAK